MKGAIHWLRCRFCIKYPPARRRPSAPTPACVAPLHVIAGSLHISLVDRPPLTPRRKILVVSWASMQLRMHHACICHPLMVQCTASATRQGGAASSSSKAGRTSPTSPPACSRPDGDQRLIELPPNRPPHRPLPLSQPFTAHNQPFTLPFLARHHSSLPSLPLCSLHSPLSPSPWRLSHAPRPLPPRPPGGRPSPLAPRPWRQRSPLPLRA